MTNKSTLAQGLSHAWPWTKPIGSSPTTSRLLRFSLLCMLVLLCGGSAWAQDYYQKITSTNDLTDGEYLIVYEGDDSHDAYAFDGSLENLDQAKKGLAVTIKEGVIAGSNTINAATFTIAKKGDNYTIKSASGYYIGQTSYSNGLNSDKETAYDNAISFENGAVVIKSSLKTASQVTLRYNYASDQLRFRYYKSGQQAIHLYKRIADLSDTRTETVLLFDGEYQTTGEVGGSMELPTTLVKTVVDGVQTGTLNEPTITWESSNTAVATIDGNTISFVGVGKSTITASYAGNETQYKPSSNSFELTVSKAPYTTIADILNDITSTKTEVTYKFENLLVTYVNGQYNYVSDGTNAFLFFGSNLNLSAGDIISGTATGQIYTFNGLPEMAVTTDNLSVTTTSTGNEVTYSTIEPSAINDYVNKPIIIKNAVFVQAGTGKNLTFKVGENTFAVYNNWSTNVSSLVSGNVYTLTGVGAVYTNKNTTTYQLYLISATEEKFYILGVNDANENDTWDIPDEFVEMTWDTENEAYTYELNNTTDAYFCFSTNNEVSDWDTFNSTYRWALGTGGNYTFDLDNLGTALELSQGDKTIVLPAGQWTISVSTDMKLTITGEATPVEEHTYIVAGSEAEIFGTSWDGTNEANKMTKQTDGTYQKTYTVNQAYNNVQLKVVKDNDKWYGDANDKNIIFNLTGAGNFTVSIDPTTSKITVTGDIVQFPTTFEYEKVVAAGNGEDTWLNGANWDPGYQDNQMTEVSDGVWEISFENVPEGYTRKIKFAIDGAWTHNFGGTFSEFGVATDAVYNGDNIEFDTENDLQNIKVQLDLREFDFTTKEGAKFTITSEAVEEPAAFQDFEAIINNQTGTLLTTEEQVQNTAVNFGIAVDAEGKTTRVETDDASAIATISGTYHSEHGLTGMKLVTAVPGAVKILVGKCTYAGSKITVTNSDGQTVAEYTPQGEQGSGDRICWKNDHSNLMELIYTGEATTLTITGMQYCPYIAVKKYVAPAEFQDFEAIINNQTGTLLTTEEQVQNTAVNFGIAVDAEGKTTRVETDDASAIATISGTYHSEHGLTGMKLVTAVPGAVKILVGKCTYAGSKITVTNSDGQTVAEYTPQGEQGSGDRICWKNDHSNLMELIYTGEATTLTITGMQYCPYIAVKKITETEPITLDNEPATVTFPFDLGTEGQKATFSNEDYWLNSKVTWGSNFTANDTRTVSEITETQLKAIAKETQAAESNLIKFTITPKPGFTFTPTKVTFTATRIGTDDGALDVAWLNSNKSTATLANLKRADGNLPARESKTPNYTTFTYDLTTVNGIIAGEGECGLQLNLYAINAGKNYGFANIIIEGTLSGTEQELPILASFNINNTEYTVDDVFGDQYEATLKLSKSETMVSSENAVTATAASGEVGTITYSDASETACKVTIPVTAGETTMNYVLNVVQKPDFTLTYYGVDGTTVLDTETREEDQTIGQFKIDIADVDASKDGYKARGWFKNNYVGAKHKTTDVVTSDLSLYAVETEIEVSSDFKKYVFDLTDINFDANDHEAFNPTGGTPNVSDMRHGWGFKNGDKIELLVGAKASIIINTCQYPSNGTTKITASNGVSIDAVSSTDGATATIEYEGEPGTLTLTFDGSAYVHKLTILNTTTTNYEKDGDWIIVKAGDASSFLDALDAANGTSGTDPVYIFLPNGEYDLAQNTLTTIGRSNVSIIGQSMEDVIIKNMPPISTESIDKTATLMNTGNNNYFQDLTIQNDLDYYKAVDELNMSGARAVALWDTGTNTICKNVKLMSHQDTYYTNNANGEYYWETSDIHGTVDFICGEGTLFVENSTLTVEKRYKSKNGGCTITAPSTAAGKEYGYVFNNCKIDNSATSFNFGRAWNNEPRCAYLNTTITNDKLISDRWTLAGMNDVPAKAFYEYNTTTDAEEDAPTSWIVTFTASKSTATNPDFQTILSDEQAANFTLAKVFPSWTPATDAAQVDAPKAELKDGVISWTKNDDATAYALFKDGKFLGITTGTTWTVEEAAGAPRRAEEPEKTGYTIRAANSRGGFGEPAEVSPATGINATLNDSTKDSVIYDLNGRRVMTPTKGVYIINGKKVVIK